MSNQISQLSVAQLERAVELRKQIAALEAELNSLGSGLAPKRGPGRRTMSASARARIAEAQRARWARQNGGTSTAAPRKKRTMSPAARARIAAAQKARWAKVKAGK